MDCIVTENLTLSYGEKPIISDLNLKIPKGKITVIIGSNGCGKSTLLKSIARILKPDSGTIRIDGMDISRISSKKIARKMAVLPQSPKAPEGLKVRHLVAYGRFPYKKGFGSLNKEDFEIIDNSLKISGIWDFRDKDLGALSGGQRQRAWIAMALCQDTEVLLLDEPTTYLDLAHQLDVLKLLSKLNQEMKRTVVMVLHELNNASRFADYMVGMKAGKIVAAGTPAEVMTKDNMREIYNIDADLVVDKKTNKPMYLSYENIQKETV